MNGLGGSGSVLGPSPWPILNQPARGFCAKESSVPKLCLTQAHFYRIPGHLQRMWPPEASLSVASSYAYLRELRPRSENPGVGGSIPSQPTIRFFVFPKTYPSRSFGHFLCRLLHLA